MAYVWPFLIRREQIACEREEMGLASVSNVDLRERASSKTCAGVLDTSSLTPLALQKNAMKQLVMSCAQKKDQPHNPRISLLLRAHGPATCEKVSSAAVAQYIDRIVRSGRSDDSLPLT